MEYIQYIIVGLTSGSIYALIALGFYIAIAATGILDFAQGEKVVLGGLITLFLLEELGMPFPIALIVALAIGFILGAIFERLVITPTYRSHVTVPVIATLGASIFFFYGEQVVWGPHSRAFPAFTEGQINFLDLTIRYQSFWIWGTVLLVLLCLYLLFTRTRVGQSMVAAATDREGASLVGINVTITRIFAFSLAFALAVLAGILVAPITMAGGFVGTSLTIKGFAGLVVGGMTHPLGAVVGSLLVGVLENVVSGAISYGYRDPSVYMLLIATLMFRPTGILGGRKEGSV